MKLLKRALFAKTGISTKVTVASIILLVNTFTWYFFAFNVLRDLTDVAQITNLELLGIWSINIAGMATSAILGAMLMDRLKCRVPFLLLWMFSGIFFSLTPLITGLMSSLGVAVISAVFGIYFGLGMPACMGYFTDATISENRSRLAGVIFLLIGVGFFLLGSIGVQDVTINALILAGWRGLGLLFLLLLKIKENIVEKRNYTKYTFILSNRQFVLYFIPWCMFSLVNSMAIPVVSKFFEGGEEFVGSSMIVENVLAGLFAVVGGFFADSFGRKRLAMIGFAMLGMGYAIVGFSSGNMFGWWFYTIVDGIAWGAFGTIFLLTIWGDLAHMQKSEKYYAIGGLPFLFSNFIRLSVGSYIADNITSIEAVFSFAAFFLFLAVLPLIYAPETLPEKTMKDREMKNYIEKAQREAEKAQRKEVESAPIENEDDYVKFEGAEFEEKMKEAEKYY
jgi:MFS family permease